MKISDIQTGMSNVELKAKVVEKGEVRQVNTRFGPSSVCDCVIEDDTGHMKLTLWSKQIDTIKVGDTIEITGGYIREWREEKQISIARTGQINVVPAELPSLGEAEAPAEEELEAPDEEPEEEPTEAPEGPKKKGKAKKAEEPSDEAEEVVEETI